MVRWLDRSVGGSAGNILLAGTGLSGDEHGHVRGGHHGNVLTDGTRGRPCPFNEHRMTGARWCRSTNGRTGSHRRAARSDQCILDAHQQFVRIQGFADVIERPLPHELNGQPDIGITGDDDDLRGRGCAPDVLKHLQAIRIRQPVVAQDKVEVAIRHQLLCDHTTTSGRDRIPVLGEEP